MRDLADRLGNTKQLKGFATVSAGKNALIRGRQAQSIVLVPIGGPYESAADTVDTYADVHLQIVAHLWAKPSSDDPDGLDAAWEMRQRLIAALWEQGIGDPLEGSDTAAGYQFNFVDEAWDTTRDSGQQGQAIEVTFDVTFSASSKSLRFGEVDDVSLTRVATLTADLAVDDLVASIDVLFEYPETGVLQIDSEQIGYSGFNLYTDGVMQFKNLVRGINGTTPAAHSAGAKVNVTPSP